MKLKLGIIGYSASGFDADKAKKIISIGFDEICRGYKDIEIVSGLTDIGIPGLAYHEAKKRGYSTVGIACEKAKEYKCFPCDKVIIIGKEWGDESEYFIKYINFLFKIGGGKQSEKEIIMAEKAKIESIEIPLNELP